MASGVGCWKGGVSALVLLCLAYLAAFLALPGTNFEHAPASGMDQAKSKESPEQKDANKAESDTLESKGDSKEKEVVPKDEDDRVDMSGVKREPKEDDGDEDHKVHSDELNLGKSKENQEPHDVTSEPETREEGEDNNVRVGMSGVKEEPEEEDGDEDDTDNDVNNEEDREDFDANGEDREDNIGDIEVQEGKHGETQILAYYLDNKEDKKQEGTFTPPTTTSDISVTTSEDNGHNDEGVIKQQASDGKQESGRSSEEITELKSSISGNKRVKPANRTSETHGNKRPENSDQLLKWEGTVDSNSSGTTPDWNSRDLYSLEVSEQEDFFRYKEAQYSQRRDWIYRACSKQRDLDPRSKELRLMSSVNPYYFLHIPQHQMAVCHVPKVTCLAHILKNNSIELVWWSTK